jgi:phenylacetic acid degradation operon negative regulatory protein
VRLKARNLILNTLLAAGDGGQTVRAAIASCGLFGIRENTVRVALVRLAAEGLIESTGRGTYRLGPRAVALARDVATWRTAETRVRTWDGGWITVHVGALQRSNRVALRSRSRALALLGLRELDPGLHVRPDNLVGGVDEVRTRLLKLGLDTAAAVFVASGFDADRETRARALWDGRSLTQTYCATREGLERWLALAGSLAPDVSAREAFVLGNEAIRLLVFDPLLPSPLVDVDERRAFAAAVRRHDEAGRAIWRRLRLTPGGADVAPPHSFDLELLSARTRP